MEETRSYHTRVYNCSSFHFIYDIFLFPEYLIKYYTSDVSLPFSNILKKKISIFNFYYFFFFPPTLQTILLIVTIRVNNLGYKQLRESIEERYNHISNKTTDTILFDT